MDRIYAWDDHNERVVYRIPGQVYPDGREDSDLSPVWLPEDRAELPEGINVEELQRVSVKD